MELEIEKDDIVVYGQALPTSEASEVFVQIGLGMAENSDEFEFYMNIPDTDYSGEYKIKLTATLGNRVTAVSRTLIYNDGEGTYTPGGGTDLNTPVTQTPIEVLEAALDTTGWYVVCPAGIDESQYEGIAEWTEAQTKMFAYTFLSKTNPVGAIYFRSHGWCGLVNDEDDPSDVPTSNEYLHIAASAKALSYPAGSETWAFKTLAAVYPSNLSGMLKKSLTESHSNYFAQYAGKNISMNGQMCGGEWIDVIRGRDWLQNDMRLRIYNLLLTNPKIPYTNSGIALVHNEMIASLKAAQERGIVAENEYYDDGTIVPGFTANVPNAQNLTATQKASRVLGDCTFSARLAGAIHVVEVNGVLTY